MTYILNLFLNVQILLIFKDGVSWSFLSFFLSFFIGDDDFEVNRSVKL